MKLSEIMLKIPEKRAALWKEMLALRRWYLSESERYKEVKEEIEALDVILFTTTMVRVLMEETSDRSKEEIAEEALKTGHACARIWKEWGQENE